MPRIDPIDLRLFSGFRSSPLRTRAAGRIGAANDALRFGSLTKLSTQLGTLRSSLERLRDREAPGTGSARSRAGEPATAIATTALALTSTPSATTLRSSEEVNAITTSFTPFGPEIQSGAPPVPPLSTTLATIGGEYNGDQGDDTLSFEFRHSETVGNGDRLRVRVYDGAGDRIETLRFDDVQPGEAVTLENGLTLTLAAGTTRRDETFSVDVSTSVGSAVDPDKAFDGVRNDDPNFEPGVSVVAGSFEVNGETIAVAADDTISAVVARITAQVDGVTASFDVASETVLLQNDAVGGTPITLGNDSSGFLAATKLDSATAELGNDGLLSDDPIESVPALASVSSGTFSVNDETFTIDISSDSLDSVLAQLNASDAGVTASLDRESGIVSIVSDDPQAVLRLDDGTSGFLSAIAISPFDREPELRAPAPRRSGFRRLEAVASDLRDLKTVLNELFRPTSDEFADREFVRNGLREAIRSSFAAQFDTESSAIFRASYGLDFDFTRADEVVELDASRFERASINAFGSLHDFLFAVDASDEPEGVVASLLAVVERLEDGVDRSLEVLDPRGRLLDVLA